MEIIQKILDFVQSNQVAVIGGAIYVLIEFFLGKTTLVKAGSTLEAVLNGVVKVLELLKIKKPAA